MMNYIRADNVSSRINTIASRDQFKAIKSEKICIGNQMISSAIWNK